MSRNPGIPTKKAVAIGYKEIVKIDMGSFDENTIEEIDQLKKEHSDLKWRFDIVNEN